MTQPENWGFTHDYYPILTPSQKTVVKVEIATLSQI